MDLDLAGKRAFISGSTQGIGFAVAEALSAEGVDVVLNGRSQERVDAAVERLRAASPASDPAGIAANVAVAEEVDDLVEQLGPVDILVNNVGIFGLDDFGSITDADWQRYFDINVMSGVRLSRALLPGMLQRGWGRIVFVSSESGVTIPADMIHYGTSKASMIALGNGLAKLTRGTAVTVNTVLGGPTYSDGVAETVTAIAESQSVPAEEIAQSLIAQNRTTLLERFLEPAEIANLIVFLSSPKSSATNGTAVRADGGVLTSML